MAVERIATGIPGFDDLVDGGLERGSQTLVVGDVGAGKTIFGLHYLVGGAKRGDTGLFVTFEESPASLHATMADFGWPSRDEVLPAKIHIIDVPLEELAHEVDAGFPTIVHAIEDIQPDRVVVDSIGSIVHLRDDLASQKASMVKLLFLLREAGCTSLLLAQPEEEPSAHKRHGGLALMADGVVGLNYVLSQGDTRYRSIEVVKMRRTNHHNKRVWFAIKDGIQVDYEGSGSIIWLRKK